MDPLYLKRKGLSMLVFVAAFLADRPYIHDYISACSEEYKCKNSSALVSGILKKWSWNQRDIDWIKIWW